jgi:hypothetical protein
MYANTFYVCMCTEKFQGEFHPPYIYFPSIYPTLLKINEENPEYAYWKVNPLYM